MKDNRPGWLEMYNHLESGGTATAYYAAGQPTNVICVHVGREELSGPSTSSIWHDPMFVVSEPNSDWVGTVTVSEVGRRFMAGELIRTLAAEYGLGNGDKLLLKSRRDQMSKGQQMRDRSAQYRKRPWAKRQALKRQRSCKLRRATEAQMNNG